MQDAGYEHAHSSPIKTWQQLVVVVVLAFLIPVIGIILLTQLITSDKRADPATLSPEAVAARIQPVARVAFGDAAAPAGVLKSGQGFYGVGNTGFVSPIIMSQQAARAQFGTGAKLASAMVKPTASITDQALAAELQGQYLPEGLVATQIRDQVERGLAANRGFFQLMQGFLALGLIVGIAGLGVVMVRAVRERRRNIGVLRALGFQSGTIQRAFLTESTFVALEGIVLGTALSIVTSYLLFKNDEELNASGVGFPIPWTSIAVLVAAAALASVLATVWPARQASKIRPAVALRIAD